MTVSTRIQATKKAFLTPVIGRQRRISSKILRIQLLLFFLMGVVFPSAHSVSAFHPIPISTTMMEQPVVLPKNEHELFHGPQAGLVMHAFSSDTSSAESTTAAAAFVASLQFSGPKMVVFDKDGTLGDCSASLRRWVLHKTERIRNVLAVSSEEEMDIFIAEFHHRIGWDAHSNDVFPSAPVAAGTWDDIVTLVYDFLVDNQDQLQVPVTRELTQKWHHELGDLHGQDTPLLDDLKAMMLNCKRLGYTIGVCTSDDRQGTDMAMKSWKIDDVVDVSVCGDEVTHGKPSAVPLQKLCQLASERHQQGHIFLPQNCVVVGDTSSDTGMARAASAGFCVGVLTGSGTTEQLLGTGAHLILPHVGHIPTLLETFDLLSEQQEKSQ